MPIARPTVEAATQITRVQIEGLVLMDIINHCQSMLPQMATGQLLGLDVGTDLQVTSSFPFIFRPEDQANEEEVDAETTTYQYEMMRCLREVNVDANPVGWYLSTWMEGYLVQTVLQTQFSYQSELGVNSICLMFDPLKTTQGKLALKALRFTDVFFGLYKSGDFTQEVINERGLTTEDLFQEIPIVTKNNCLVDAFIAELALSKQFHRRQQEDASEMAVSSYLTKSLENLLDGVEDLSEAFQKYSYRKAQQQRKDGESRTPKPSRLESLLLTKQLVNHCNYLEDVAMAEFEKLYFSDVIAKVAKPGDQH